MPAFYFASLQEFLAMGGYGFFVWLSFGVSLLLLVGLHWHASRAERQFKQLYALRLAREARVRQHAQHTELKSTQETLNESSS